MFILYQTGGYNILKKLTLLFVAILTLCSCTYQEPNETHTELYGTNEDYPVVLLDAQNDDEQSHIICGIRSGQLKLTDEYQYNGQALSTYLFEPATEVQTNIINTDELITFIDPAGSYTEAEVDHVKCESQIIDETVRVRVAMTYSLMPDSQWLLGTYSKVDIFPKDIIYGEDFISVDLDNDGNRDVISWLFVPTDNKVYSDNNYYFTIMVEQNGTTHCIKDDKYLPIKKDDLAVFVADINLDGCYELIVCERGMSRFGIASIYQLSDDGYTLVLKYYLNSEP
jgi:hypothetical protein